MAPIWSPTICTQSNDVGHMYSNVVPVIISRQNTYCLHTVSLAGTWSNAAEDGELIDTVLKNGPKGNHLGR